MIIPSLILISAMICWFKKIDHHLKYFEEIKGRDYPGFFTAYITANIFNKFIAVSPVSIFRDNRKTNNNS